MERFLGPGGELSKIIENFEHRRGQVTMAQRALKAFNEGGALLVEAGTGIGKTLAYLIPAILSNRKIVISTGTKNLQEQIIGKDIPVVQKLFPGRFKAALMKGRGNYLCKRRFKNFAQQPLFVNTKEGKMFAAIHNWAPKTSTGDRAELSGLPDNYKAWSDINSKSDLCLGSACPTYESCFITKMRSDAATADIVVVNHHLFFADLNLRENSFGEVIPRYDAAVFDEAHIVEETATTYFGVSIS
ncbi:MAG TPA: ATP-dependent DNA helicase, partial [Nitrospirae bacterium]|nr:ATP-dependent DNA helicase [Nitrospirota bacterium]